MQCRRSEAESVTFRRTISPLIGSSSHSDSAPIVILVSDSCTSLEVMTMIDVAGTIAPPPLSRRRAGHKENKPYKKIRRFQMIDFARISSACGSYRGVLTDVAGGGMRG